MSKLGVHVIRYSDWVVPFLEAGATSATVVDNVPWARGLASRYPSAYIVERVYHPQQLSDFMIGNPDPKTAANKYAATYFLPYRNSRPTNGAKTWVMSINEPVIGNAYEADWYARFGAELGRIHISEGYGTVLGNFASGNPELHLWRYMGPWAELWGAYPNQVLLGLHEYGHWAHQPGTAPGQDSWLMLRYRRVFAELSYYGLGTPRVIMPETGLDETNVYPEPAKQQFANPINDDQFLSHMMKYDVWLMSDPRIIGADIFTWAGGWPNFQMEDRPTLCQKLLDWVKVSKGQNMTAPTVNTAVMGRVRLKVDLNVRKAPWFATAPPVVGLVSKGSVIPYYDKSARTGWLMIDVEGDRWISGLDKYVEFI